MITRLFYIFLIAFLLSCNGGDYLDESGNSIEDMPLLRGVELSGEGTGLPHIRYNIGETDNDSIVELQFLYVEEYDDGIIWEEGAVRIPQATMLRYNGMPLVRNGSEHGY